MHLLLHWVDIYIISAEFSEFDKILKEQSLELPPKPPQKRIWHGSTVAPFAGNNMLVLYSCPANNTSKYFVQVLHNERPIPLAVSLLPCVFNFVRFFLCNWRTTALSINFYLLFLVFCCVNLAKGILATGNHWEHSHLFREKKWNTFTLGLIRIRCPWWSLRKENTINWFLIFLKLDKCTQEQEVSRAFKARETHLLRGGWLRRIG